jgi:hypothetical protein
MDSTTWTWTIGPAVTVPIWTTTFVAELIPASTGYVIAALSITKHNDYLVLLNIGLALTTLSKLLIVGQLYELVV